VGTDVLCCEPLMEDPLVLVVHPQHPWAEKRGILFKEITEETLLISNPNTSLVNYLEKEGRLSLEPSRLYVAGNIEAIKRGIRNHQGISIMSEYAVRQELELGLLKQVPLLDHPGLKRQLYTIFRKDTRFKLSTSLFLEFFRKAAEDNRLLSQL
jgi:DNA-binding transcriptional LysR family regulator